MAANNRRSAAVHPDPPSLPLAPSPPSKLCYRLKTILYVSGFILAIFAFPFLYVPYPSFELVYVSATRLSITTPATWNFSLQISNPNPIWSIAYDEFHVSLFYISNNDFFESQLIAETKLDAIFQTTRWADKILYLNICVSRENVGNITYKKIVRDQRKGLVGFQVGLSFKMKYWKYDDDWKFNRIFCSDMNMVFNNSGPGFSSDLPKECHFPFAVQEY